MSNSAAAKGMSQEGAMADGESVLEETVYRLLPVLVRVLVRVTLSARPDAAGNAPPISAFEKDFGNN